MAVTIDYIGVKARPSDEAMEFIGKEIEEAKRLWGMSMYKPSGNFTSSTEILKVAKALADKFNWTVDEGKLLAEATNPNFDS